MSSKQNVFFAQPGHRILFSRKTVHACSRPCAINTDKFTGTENGENEDGRGDILKIFYGPLIFRDENVDVF